MRDILLNYYFSSLEVFVLLLLLGGVGVAVNLVILKRWRNRLGALEQELNEVQAKYNGERLQALYDHLRSAVAHEFVKGLDFISKKSAQTLEGLGKEQNVLRDQQKRIIAKAHDLIQHASNIMAVFASEQREPQKELLNVKQLVECVLLELYLYAESAGVTLRTDLKDVEPVLLDREPVLMVFSNVIHNAIKYSFPGGVVKVSLYLERDEQANGSDMICSIVKDTGRGIPKKDHDRIFEPKKRGDGLIEPGSGLGLYCAREAARSQGGDVILVASDLNRGSVFKIVLPYRNP